MSGPASQQHTLPVNLTRIWYWASKCHLLYNNIAYRVGYVTRVTLFTNFRFLLQRGPRKWFALWQRSWNASRGLLFFLVLRRVREAKTVFSCTYAVVLTYCWRGLFRFPTPSEKLTRLKHHHFHHPRLLLTCKQLFSKGRSNKVNSWPWCMLKRA